MKFLFFLIIIILTSIHINSSKIKLNNLSQNNQSSKNNVILNFLQEYIDEGIDPCSDFYQFTCGKWLSRNMLNEKSLHNNEDNLNEFVNNQVMSLLKKNISNKSRTIKMLKIVFDKCISNFPMNSLSICLKFINNQMSYAVDSLYVNEKITKNDMNEVSKVLKNLKNIFITTFKRQNWLKNEEKNEIIMKVKNMHFHFSYDSIITNYTILDEYYQNLFIKEDDNFNEIKNKLKSFVVSDLFQKKYENNDYNSLTSKATATYFDEDNKVFIGAGYINLPFYHIKLPKSMIYGAFGSLIGHEIMHAFDMNGLKFDKNSKMTKWFSEETEEKFKKKSKCFVKQYDKYIGKQSKMHINGKATLNENIADNEGLKISFMAYKTNVKMRNKLNIRVLKNYTNEQLFFIAYGMSFCTNRSIKNEVQLIKYGEYSSERYRVIGAVSNNNDFMEAFGCKLDTPMNSLKKCRIWN
ncbi:Phosphate-regulating neutral endopeptidase [Strongyloides ratti]|uniref:Phosphate-regulating neutral endopeptidase n=1 Tax=Strongyloides ratti TaxID=34506 RepID=A0A090LFE3_STRRB|nr:Phosphate-regulating neutral endopeptidase [Strongyloides ratti]CEF68492.1 Phosphate-regulating neutral endopeptidase [Strongyloides ratti]